MTADEIKEIRQRAGFSQQDLCRLIGMHSMTVSKWERGIAHPKKLPLFLLRAMHKHCLLRDPSQMRDYASMSLDEFWRTVFAS